MNSLYLAWRHLSHHRFQTATLVAALTLMLLLPAGMALLVDQCVRQLRRRAAATPLLVGAPGSATDLTLHALYFQTSSAPRDLPYAEMQRAAGTGLASAYPLYVHHTAHGKPVVGVTLDYFEFRQLQPAEGRVFALLGECVAGAAAARDLQLGPGATVLTTPHNVFDLAGETPLRLRVRGVLAPTGTPDDQALFVDLKTAWIVSGLGHGHAAPVADGQSVTRSETRSSAGASEANEANESKAADRLNVKAADTHLEITPENAASFHFHGDLRDFPLTAVIVAPRDAKRRALLRGRYDSASSPAQLVRPAEVMEDLLRTVLRIRGLVLAGLGALAAATGLTICLVFALSWRLRRAELLTLDLLGASRARRAAIVGWELALLVSVAALLAAGFAIMARRSDDLLIRWLLS